MDRRLNRTGVMVDNEKPTAFFVPSLGGGGAERVVVTLLGEWVSSGLPADLVVCRPEGPFRHEVPDEVRLIDLGARRVSLAVPRLAGYLRTTRPAALLSALDHANTAAIVACKLAGSPTRVVVSVHTALGRHTVATGSWKRRLLVRAVRWTYPLADGVVAVSEGAADDLAEVARIARKKITVIPNPIVTDALRRQAEVSLDHPWFGQEEVPVVLGVGRLEPVKDFGTLLDAVAIARRARPLRLVLMGEGSERGLLAARAEALGLDENTVWFAGFQANPFAFMKQSAVMVLSSLYEGFGNVLVEAMACGTPVVSTACEGGPAQILEGGRLGPLVPVGDPEAMAAAILDTLAAPPRAGVLQERARAFDASVIAGQYREVLLGPESSRIRGST